MPETRNFDTQPSFPSIEVNPEILDEILQSDEMLAARALDRSIQEAEVDPDTDPGHLMLLRFQRSLVDMSDGDAFFASLRFASETGKYADFPLHTVPKVHYPLVRGFVVSDLAYAERWRIVGVDPLQYGDDPYGRGYKHQIEEVWREAKEARQSLLAAQAAEVEAMERAIHPPVFVPRHEA